MAFTQKVSQNMTGFIIKKLPYAGLHTNCV